MAKSPMESFEIPQELRNIAETNVEQARKSFEKFIETAQKTAAGVEGQAEAARENVKTMTEKAMKIAEDNVTASLDYAQRVVRAQDVGEMMRIHAEYVQSQMRALAEQAQEFGQSVTKAALDAVRPKF